MDVSIHTCTHTLSVNLSPDTGESTRLEQPYTTVMPSLKIDMMATEGGLVEWNAMNNLIVRQGSKERGEAWQISRCVLFFMNLFSVHYALHPIRIYPCSVKSPCSLALKAPKTGHV